MSRTPTDTSGPKRAVKVIQNGPAIRSLREKDGYPQTDFARKLGVFQSTLSNIERETKSTSRAMLNRIARELRVPVAAIMRDHAITPEAKPAPEDVAA